MAMSHNVVRTGDATTGVEGSDAMQDEVWVLGATGRTGRAIAARLTAMGVPPVLVGRDATRLQEAATGAGGGARTIVAGSVASMIAEVRRRRPAVVVNTVGPFADTAGPIARACLPGSHYVDLANDVLAASALLGLHEEAVAAGRILVTGTGFGVLATESVVVKLCQGRPVPDRVRVDAVPSVATEAGVLGEALAATIIGGLPAGGRRYERGRLVRTRLGSDVAHLTLPDGARVTTASVPFGELIAAQRASGAPFVVAASSLAPTAPAVRAILPLATLLLSITPLRTFAQHRLARLRTTPQERPREHSWGHAHVRWADGTTREGWLRTGDGMDFTSAVAAEVAHRLLKGEGRPGAHTPGALFGPELAEAVGGEFMLDEGRESSDRGEETH